MMDGIACCTIPFRVLELMNNTFFGIRSLRLSWLICFYITVSRPEQNLEPMELRSLFTTIPPDPAQVKAAPSS